MNRRDLLKSMAGMPVIAGIDIAVVDVKPETIITAKLTRPFHRAEVARIQRQLEKQFPNHRVLVITEGVVVAFQ